MVARFDSCKDHSNLLAALSWLVRRNLDFRVALVGAGNDDYNLSLVERIKILGLTSRCYLLGSRSDIPSIMNAIDIHVLSSLTEAFPNVLAEAMACETPCVTTDVGDAALIVSDNGWIVPPCNSLSLAQALYLALTSLADSGSWTLRKTACRRHITTKFSIEQMVARYNAVWQRLARIDA